MTTPPGKLNIKIYKGAAFTELLTLEDEDEAGVRSIVDLTGYTARAQARADYNAATAFMDLTTENGGITLGASSGTIALFMAATATDDITVESGVWDLELIPPSGAANVIRILQGSVCVSEEATK